MGGIIAIGVILLITFRSLSIPLILLFTIEGAIWINMALPYFQDRTSTTLAIRLFQACNLAQLLTTPSS